MKKLIVMLMASMFAFVGFANAKDVVTAPAGAPVITAPAAVKVVSAKKAKKVKKVNKFGKKVLKPAFDIAVKK